MLTTVFTAAVAASHLLAARAFCIAFLLLVPGTAVLAATRLRHSSGLLRVVAAVTASLSTIMLLGLVGSEVLPHVGIARPLDRWPMVGAVDLATLVASALAARRVDPVAWLLGPVRVRAAVGLASAGLASLPIAAMAGATLLNGGGSGGLAAAASLAAWTVLLGCFVLATRLSDGWMGAALFAAGLSTFYSLSERSNYLLGYDIQQEYQAFAITSRVGAWHVPPHGDAYRSMLSITALPVALSRMSGVSGVEVFKTVFPIVLALFPVAVLVVASRWVERRAAFAGAAGLVVLPSFAHQMPGLARQEVGMLVFGALVALVFDTGIPRRTREAVAIGAGATLAASHYTSAYIAAATIAAAYLVYGFARLIRRSGRSTAMLRLPVVAGILVCVVGWNVGITHSAEHVGQVASSAVRNGALVLPNAGTGSLVDRWLNGNTPASIGASEYYARIAADDAATKPWINAFAPAVTRAYPAVPVVVPGTPSHVPAVKRVLLVAAPLASQLVLLAMAIGVILLLRSRGRPEVVEFAFLGLAFLALLALFRVSGTIAQNYNPERAQAQAWVVTGVGLALVVSLLLRWIPRMGAAVVAGVLAVQFLVGSGFGVALGGGTPSVALANTGEEYDRFYVTDQEVAAARWLAANRTRGATVWTDRYGLLRLVFVGVTDPWPVVDLTPSTIDRNSYVLADTANVGGRARGTLASGEQEAVYAFPAGFLGAEKSVIYANNGARIYR